MADHMFQLPRMTKVKPLSKRERNLADIRERAIPIAERIVLDQGIEALSARGLAKELNVSVGSLYNAFGDLDAVVRAVIANSAAMLQAALYAAIETSAPDRRSRVIALGEAYFDFALAEPRRWWLMFEYKTNIPPDPKAQEYQTGLLEMLIRAGGGDPKSEQDRQFFLLMWASVHGLVSLACRPAIVTINPDVARTYIGDLVDSGLNALPAD